MGKKGGWGDDDDGDDNNRLEYFIVHVHGLEGVCLSDPQPIRSICFRRELEVNADAPLLIVHTPHTARQTHKLIQNDPTCYFGCHNTWLSFH